MTKWPNVMVGNISPILKWANIMLRQISPLFQKFGFIYSRTLFSDYGFHLGCEEGHISPTFKNLVQRQTNSSKWWNNITWCWDIFLPSWNEITSCWDKFLPFLKIWLCHYSDIILLLWLSSRMYRGTNFSHFKNLGSKSDEVL